MAKSVLSADRFHNEEAAFDYVEAQLWANGPVCPHCQNADAARIGRMTKRPANFRRKTHNPIVMSLVERGGDIRSTMLDHRSAMGIVRKNVHHESTLMTDTTTRYKFAPVADHQMVDHSKFEWTRGEA